MPTNADALPTPDSFPRGLYAPAPPTYASMRAEQWSMQSSAPGGISRLIACQLCQSERLSSIERSLQDWVDRYYVYLYNLY